MPGISVKPRFAILHRCDEQVGSFGIPVISPRILGCERAYARSHPKMRPSSRQISESQQIAFDNRATFRYNYRIDEK
jgi:hypothetical protein